MSERTPRCEHFRSAIAAFIAERRENKLKGKENDTDTAAKYDYETWLADAARRAGQVQIVTHVLKAAHPDARGTSVHVEPAALPRHTDIGSHHLGDDYVEDVVGNAAALDVFKFLKLEIEGRRLLDWMRAGDADLRDALHEDAEIASEWMTSFSNLLRGDGSPVSHAMAKQIYWLIGDEPASDTQYHLLQPMFSSILAHAVHTEIQDARFGESNKVARQAFRSREAHETTYRDYRGLVARKLGGTKPQNISQLNSERGGINYLLASLPPRWNTKGPLKLSGLTSAMGKLFHIDEVRDLIKQLGRFLLSEPPANEQTRRFRRRIEQQLGAQLALFGAETAASLEPGWTRDPNCTLSPCEKLWLDPERTELPVRNDPRYPDETQDDHDFNAAYALGTWPDEVAGRFANGINERLREAGLTAVGETEYRHWAKQAIVDSALPAPTRPQAVPGGSA